ncbi:MAG: GNAT family N-acetyltransferase [Vicinamibacteraceae bacterium]
MLLPEGVSIRDMTPADIAAGLALCRASGWNQTEQDWRFFLTEAPHGALVAEEAGRVIGTVATLPYGSFTWISMVLVDPVARGRQVGTTLLQRGLDLVGADATARLDATPAGEVIYRTIGFASEYRLARWFLDVTPPVARRSAAQPLAVADWPAIRQMDQRAFGAPRRALLRRLAAEAPEYARVIRRGSDVQGYVFGRHGHTRDHLGPLVADGPDTAAALLDSILTEHPHRRFYLDVPDDRREWRDVLSGLGFAIERPFLRMHRGPLEAPGEPSAIYAIAGPEFG